MSDVDDYGNTDDGSGYRTRRLWKDPELEIAVREGPGGEIVSICVAHGGKAFWRTPAQLMKVVWHGMRWDDVQSETKQARLKVLK